MDAVVPNGAAPRHHDQATFATAERREATRLPAPNRELTNRSQGKSAPTTSVSGSVPQAERRILAVIATAALRAARSGGEVEALARASVEFAGDGVEVDLGDGLEAKPCRNARNGDVSGVRPRRSLWTIRASTRRGRADARSPRAEVGVCARAAGARPGRSTRACRRGHENHASRGRPALSYASGR